MKFSFLMCINKKQPFMYAAINSMFEQDYNDEYEVIIIANNCCDDLWEELKNIVNDKKNCILERTKIGQLAFNLNYGINFAKGDYIVRMDADDVCSKNRLTITDRYIKKYNPDVIGSSVNVINEGSVIQYKTKPNILDHEIRRILPFRNPFTHPSVAIRRDVLLKQKGYLNGSNSEDYDLWIRLSRDKNIKFMNMDENILSYRINNYQIKGSKLAYCEVSGYMIREFLSGRFIYLLGFFFSMIKYVIKYQKLK